MIFTLRVKPEWHRKFFWWPTIVDFGGGTKKVLWWESFLVKESFHGDGSPARYIKNLDGTRLE